MSFAVVYRNELHIKATKNTLDHHWPKTQNILLS